MKIFIASWISFFNSIMYSMPTNKLICNGIEELIVLEYPNIARALNIEKKITRILSRNICVFVSLHLNSTSVGLKSSYVSHSFEYKTHLSHK